MSDEFNWIKMPEVQKITGRRRSWIYAQPDFPQPIDGSWLRAEVVDYVRKRIAQRDAKAEQRRRELVERQERRRAKAAQRVGA
jgi:predicted DNA-binding transcriptional regulator AlpA